MKYLSQSEVEKGAAFIKAAFALGLKPGESGKFTCPICGHAAIAKAALNNGHIHAVCAGCDTGLMQ